MLRCDGRRPEATGRLLQSDDLGAIWPFGLIGRQIKLVRLFGTGRPRRSIIKFGKTE
jgi:hypothetical protein